MVLIRGAYSELLRRDCFGKREPTESVSKRDYLFDRPHLVEMSQVQSRGATEIFPQAEVMLRRYSDRAFERISSLTPGLC